MTLDLEYLEKYEKIIENNPRFHGNISKAIREYIKSVVDEEESGKKEEAQHNIFSPDMRSFLVEARNNILELPYIFTDKSRHIQFFKANELSLYHFVVQTREASEHADNVFSHRFGKKIYTRDGMKMLVVRK